jgi:hypothetical protein
MSRDWLPLREHLEIHIATSIDQMIAGEQDPTWRAYLERHRYQMIEKVADKMELHFLRAALAKHAAQDEMADGVVVH